MVNSNNQNKKIVFLGDTALIISEILKKYGLEEIDEDILGKIEQGKPCLSGGDILDIVIEITQGKILEKNLVSSLQERLDIPKEKAKKIAKDVEKKLLILVKKVPEKEKKISEKPSAPIRIKPEISPEKPFIAKKPPIVEKPFIVEKPEKPLEKQKPSEEPDVYREPIE